MPMGRCSITKPSTVHALCSIDGKEVAHGAEDPTAAAEAAVQTPKEARTTALPETIRRSALRLGPGTARERRDDRDMVASWAESRSSAPHFRVAPLAQEDAVIAAVSD